MSAPPPVKGKKVIVIIGAGLSSVALVKALRRGDSTISKIIILKRKMTSVGPGILNSVTIISKRTVSELDFRYFPGIDSIRRTITRTIKMSTAR